MRILALDASLTSTGFSVLNHHLDVLECGKITTKSSEYESDRIFRICNKCRELILQYDIDKVVIEGQYVHKNKNTALKLSRLFGAIMFVVKSHELSFIPIAPSKIRSIILGGDSTKEEMAEYILNYYKDNQIVQSIGEYSDKANKSKTSDIYDSIFIGMSYLVGVQDGKEFKEG